MIRSHKIDQKGFTLVELMLAMTFVSLLLMAITVTVIQVANIYTKGLTMRSVGQVAQVLAKDMRQSIESARPLELGPPGESGRNFAPMVNLGGDPNNPDGGRLCTGSYTYIWNNGKALTNPVNKYSDNNGLIRMVKIPDNGSLYCADPSRPVDQELATEMLSGGDRQLAIQSFNIKQVATNPDAGQALYLVSMELGTNDEEALSRNVTLNSIDTSCLPPADGQKLDDYCAINKLEFTARAGNIGGLR